MRNPYKILVRKPEGKEPPGRPSTCKKIILKMVRGCGLDSHTSGQGP